MPKIKVIRVTRTEFELEGGQVFPIDPPLLEEMTPDEFQEHYDYALAFVEGVGLAGRDYENSPSMGRQWDDQDGS